MDGRDHSARRGRVGSCSTTTRPLTACARRGVLAWRPFTSPGPFSTRGIPTRTSASRRLARAGRAHGAGGQGRPPRCAAGGRAHRDRPRRGAPGRPGRLLAPAPALPSARPTPRARRSGIFGVLTNVVWTNYGPCAVEDFETTRTRLRATGHVTVYGVDKFPRMVDYVLPSGVRIADADRVRLGAHLAHGTTVMHEGFVNFNAGTLAPRWSRGASARGRRRRGIRRRRRRFDHGHAVRWWHRGHLDRLRRCARRWAARSPPSAGTCRRRGP